MTYNLIKMEKLSLYVKWLFIERMVQFEHPDSKIRNVSAFMKATLASTPNVSHFRASGLLDFSN